MDACHWFQAKHMSPLYTAKYEVCAVVFQWNNHLAIIYIVEYNVLEEIGFFKEQLDIIFGSFSYNTDFSEAKILINAEITEK